MQLKKAGAMPPEGGALPADTLATDLLRGADQIASFTGLTPRQVYHMQKHLPLFKIGQCLCARKSTLMSWVAEQEAACTGRGGPAKAEG